MAQRRALRVGVVGVGFGATVHIPAWQAEGAEVVAVCAPRRERAGAAAERFGIPHVFTDYREMLGLDSLDAVSVATPITLHHPVVMAALEAGHHVLCEKPFATDQALAREMWLLARRRGRTAMLAHEFRFASARTRVKELLDTGYVGPLQMAVLRLLRGPTSAQPPRAHAPQRDDAAQGAGHLGALGSHYVDCLRHWFGEIDTVSGQVFTHRPERTLPDTGRSVMADADDTFTFTVHFTQGGWATMTASSVAGFGSGATIEIYGRDGTLVTPQSGVNPPSHGTLLGAKLGEEALAELPIPARLESFADPRDDRLMPFRLLVREFLRGVDEGTSPSPNFYDGFRCQQILDAVRESSRTGCSVTIQAEAPS